MPIINGFDRIIVNGEEISSQGEPCLRWYCAPESWGSVPAGEEGHGGQWKKLDTNNLELHPAAKKDFWRKTYYCPLLVKDDGAILYAALSLNTVYTVTTAFTLYAQSQFDQAGIVVRLDHEHWIKTGIEVVDGKARLSCVVTNGYSDWSTQPWEQEPTTSDSGNATMTRVECTIRVHCRTEGNFVVESCRNGKDWELVRICHLSTAQNCRPDPLAQDAAVTSAFQGTAPPSGSLWTGVFGCCPIDQPGDTKVVFTQFSITKGSDFDHTA